MILLHRDVYIGKNPISSALCFGPQSKPQLYQWLEIFRIAIQYIRLAWNIIRCQIKQYIQRGYFKLAMHFILTQPCRSIALCSAQKAMPLLHNI